MTDNQTYKAGIVNDIIAVPVARDYIDDIQVICKQNKMLKEIIIEYLKLLEDVFCQLCCHKHEELGEDDDGQTIMIDTGWLDTYNYPALKAIGDIPVEKRIIRKA